MPAARIKISISSNSSINNSNKGHMPSMRGIINTHLRINLGTPGASITISNNISSSSNIAHRDMDRGRDKEHGAGQRSITSISRDMRNRDMASKVMGQSRIINTRANIRAG